MTDLTIAAYYTTSRNGDYSNAGFDFARIDGKLTAEELANFPKSLKLRVGYNNRNIRLAADGANGGKNEAGIKTIRTALKYGIPYGKVYTYNGKPAANEIPLEALLAYMG
jgi:hypothetical protein